MLGKTLLLFGVVLIILGVIFLLVGKKCRLLQGADHHNRKIRYSITKREWK